MQTVKGFGIINKTKVDVFLELTCFFCNSTDVSNLISGSSAFSKSRLNIWKLMVTYNWSLAWRILSITLLLLSLHLSTLSAVISPVISSSILGTYWLESSSFSVINFCLFMMFMGFSMQEYWSGFPFPSTVDHVLSELSTMTHWYWVALHSMAHSFIELYKAVVHMIILLVFLIVVFILSALWWRKIRGLCKLPDGRDWLWGNWVLF